MRLAAKIGAAACLIALGAVCRPSTAHADVDWTLSGVTFSDGATASGMILTDDYGNILSADITTTTVGTLPGFDYNTNGSGLNFSTPTQLVISDSGVEISILFDNALVGPAIGGFLSTDSITIGASSFEITSAGERDITAGEACMPGACISQAVTSVPEPMSPVLLGTGLAGLAFCRRRDKRRPA